jgi:hypothetical protein
MILDPAFMNVLARKAILVTENHAKVMTVLRIVKRGCTFGY